MLKLGEIKNAKGAHRETKRLGRGQGSGQGATAGKGDKGQKARAGGKVRLGFEGGQMPLYRRLPKRGFTNIFAKEYAIINLGDLTVEKITKAKLTEVTMETLKKAGILKTSLKKLKVLGNGEIKKALNFKVNAVSESAKQKIEKAGGSVELKG